MKIENVSNKRDKYKKLKNKMQEKINILDKIIKVIDENKEISETDNFETIVFKKYLEFENVTKVAKYINELGYRIKTNSYIGERKYIGTDITNIISHEADVEKELKEVVIYIQGLNYENVLKQWG